MNFSSCNFLCGIYWSIRPSKFGSSATQLDNLDEVQRLQSFLTSAAALANFGFSVWPIRVLTGELHQGVELETANSCQSRMTISRKSCKTAYFT